MSVPTDSRSPEHFELGGGFFLRPPLEKDAEELGRAIAESLESLLPWMPWAAYEPMSVQGRRRLIGEWRREFRADGSYNFVIFHGTTAIGVQGLHRRIGPTGLELGYWIHPEFNGRGISSRAAITLTTWAFSRGDVDHIEVHNDAANLASQGVARKAGFEKLLERSSPIDAPGETGIEFVWEARMGNWKRPRLPAL